MACKKYSIYFVAAIPKTANTWKRLSHKKLRKKRVEENKHNGLKLHKTGYKIAYNKIFAIL